MRDLWWLRLPVCRDVTEAVLPVSGAKLVLNSTQSLSADCGLEWQLLVSGGASRALITDDVIAVASASDNTKTIYNMPSKAKDGVDLGSACLSAELLQKITN